MSVTISDIGSAISVLCMQKETLQSKSNILNSEMDYLILKFQQDMKVISDKQKYNIHLISLVDEAIEKAVKTL